MITEDDLRTSLQLIEKHAVEAIGAMETGEEDVIEASLQDIRAVVEDLNDCLPRRYTELNEEEIGNIADSMGEL